MKILTILIIANSFNLITKYEGLRLEPYICPSGQLTVGYGHTGYKGNITEHGAYMLLLSDISKVERYLDTKNLDINRNQREALISFIFNVGITNFEKSTLLRTLEASEFDKWIYANGKILNGLIKRRKDEKELFNTPYYMDSILDIRLYIRSKEWFKGSYKVC